MTQRDSLARVQAVRRQVEQAGGAVRIEEVKGAVLVTLTLPMGYSPAQFYPGLPFFPV